MRVWHRLYISLEEKKPLRQLILSPKLINSLIALMLNTTIRVSTAGRHFFNHTGVLLIFALRYIATHTVSNHYNHACILHIQFLQKEFLPYLEMWKKSVEGRGGYSDGEKERMMLSQKTLTGIQITGMKNPTSQLPFIYILHAVIYFHAFMFIAVKSFLEFVPIVLQLPGVSFFLSDKLNQDPLEKFFGCIRQHGRVNNNPTIYEALKSTQTLRVINSIRVDSITGNCRGSKRPVSFDDLDIRPLPKRRRVYV